MARKRTQRAANPRSEPSVEALRQDILDHLFYRQARFPAVATPNDWYLALAYAVRDRLLDRWVHTAETYFEKASRTVCYLSAEFLLGPHLGNNLLNLGLEEDARKAVAELGLDYETLLAQEEEPGLGNGGLGRLAACFLDSLATLQIPTIGYGIRYEFGIFDQAIVDGWQVELTDKWLRLGNPWEIARPEIAVEVGFGGRCETWVDEAGRYRVRWIPSRVVKGVAYDTPILGYRVRNANLLRLWRAEACESFDFDAFNVGDYDGAVQSKLVSENITKVLYPNDRSFEGKRLRLEQQHFFVACSLADMIRIHLQRADDLSELDAKYAVQLNDTHPALAVVELMRLLVDEHLFAWERAWEITTRTLSYTNHTLLPEALERWSVPLFGEVLPRHLEIVYEINRRFLDEVARRYPNDPERIERMSLIDESDHRRVRMANLATVGSHAVNGVAALHSRLLTESVLADFHDLWPERFSNKTNGVTPRRFIGLANPGLSRLITETIGEGWLADLERLIELEPHAEESEFRARWRAVKRANKAALALRIKAVTGQLVDPDSLFDIQVKRFHEYKRQHLNVLHVVDAYLRLRDGEDAGMAARTVLFAGKAAPGYHMAKLIIKLIHSVGELVHGEAAIGDRLKVVFMPDFNVTNAMLIYPAADLSEQISTAGFEASGTGNMKLSLSGALTIGTLDGANVEIRERVGAEHFFLFGLDTDEVRATRAAGYRPAQLVEQQPRLAEILELIRHLDGDTFAPLVDDLLHRDQFLVLADFASYLECQRNVDAAFAETEAWTRSSILNAARCGWFSSDRTIRQYCEEIWKVTPVPVLFDE